MIDLNLSVVPSLLTTDILFLKRKGAPALTTVANIIAASSTTYLKIDASNGPLTGNLAIGAGYGLAINGTGFLGTEILRIKDGSILADGTTGNTPVTGSIGTRLMWIPSKAALVAGRLTTGGTQWDSLGTGSVTFGSNCKATGTNSFAAGSNNTASGIGSVAIGSSLTSSGLYGTVFGSANTNNSSGQSSLIAGEQNTSNAVGCFVAGYGHTINAGAEYAVTAGYGNVFATNAAYSVALGTYVNVNHAATAILHATNAASFTTAASPQAALAVEGVAAIDARHNGSAVTLGFYGVTPVPRATTGLSTSGLTFTQNSGNAINDASTFDGYTLKQVVKALRDIGALT